MRPMLLIQADSTGKHSWPSVMAGRARHQTYVDASRHKRHGPRCRVRPRTLHGDHFKAPLTNSSPSRTMDTVGFLSRSLDVCSKLIQKPLQSQHSSGNFKVSAECKLRECRRGKLTAKTSYIFWIATGRHSIMTSRRHMKTLSRLLNLYFMLLDSTLRFNNSGKDTRLRLATWSLPISREMYARKLTILMIFIQC